MNGVISLEGDWMIIHHLFSMSFPLNWTMLTVHPLLISHLKAPWTNHIHPHLLASFFQILNFMPVNPPALHHLHLHFHLHLNWHCPQLPSMPHEERPTPTPFGTEDPLHSPLRFLLFMKQSSKSTASNVAPKLALGSSL